jgi:class 3 adenylate cyclase
MPSRQDDTIASEAVNRHAERRQRALRVSTIEGDNMTIDRLRGDPLLITFERARSNSREVWHLQERMDNEYSITFCGRRDLLAKSATLEDRRHAFSLDGVGTDICSKCLRARDKR